MNNKLKYKFWLIFNREVIYSTVREHKNNEEAASAFQNWEHYIKYWNPSKNAVSGWFQF